MNMYPHFMGGGLVLRAPIRRSGRPLRARPKPYFKGVALTQFGLVSKALKTTDILHYNNRQAQKKRGRLMGG